MMTVPIVQINNQRMICLPKELNMQGEQVNIEKSDNGWILRVLPFAKSDSQLNTQNQIENQSSEREQQISKAWQAFSEMDDFFVEGRIDLPPQHRDF